MKETRAIAAVAAQVRAREAGSERVESLDLARFVMVLPVIGAHGRFMVVLSYPAYFFTYPGGWARITKPLFLMISGFYFAVQVRRGVGRWARRLALVHLLWSAVHIGLWMPPGSFSVQKAAFWLFFGAGHLWFMPALIGGGLMLCALRGPAPTPLTLVAAVVTVPLGLVLVRMNGRPLPLV